MNTQSSLPGAWWPGRSRHAVCSSLSSVMKHPRQGHTMTRKTCAHTWGTGCPLNRDGFHMCARPPLHQPWHHCYCGERAP